MGRKKERERIKRKNLNEKIRKEIKYIWKYKKKGNIIISSYRAYSNIIPLLIQYNFILYLRNEHHKMYVHTKHQNEEKKEIEANGT